MHPRDCSPCQWSWGCPLLCGRKYKCIMMYLFQRRIIYMGYAPIGSRTERLQDVSIPHDVFCDNIQVSTDKKAPLSGVILRRCSDEQTPPRTVIVYFQGNAGNPLHRIPVFTALLRAVPSLTVLAVAPRSYWTSPGRPTQSGITADYTRVLSHAAARFPHATIVAYGHSLGGAAALCVLAALDAGQVPHLRGLVLENPFASIPAMVRALYPQRWLPYHHMGPLVWDRWDAVRAVSGAGAAPSKLGALMRGMMVLVSERDEVVPCAMGREVARAAGAERLVVVRGALHEDAWTRRQWAEEMKSYVQSLERERVDQAPGHAKVVPVVSYERDTYVTG
ncbi:Alpha/Beta hydrolase protein [Amylostereum chailletii]|nr:Alpha/Beta hydrolase protein [Amylostereum chailletii]